MRILLIAPEQAELSWATEVELLGSVFPVTPLVGRVDHERLLRATSGQRFEVVHVAAHGDADGVLLSDGRLGKEELAQLVRHVRAELVFLNACRSAALGQYLACRGVPLTVTHTVAVVDANALRTASYYYEELAACDLDYVKALERVNPCDGSLAPFFGAGYVERAVAPLLAATAALQGEMRALRRAVLVGVLVGVCLVGALALILWLGQDAVAGQTVPPVTEAPVITRPPARTPSPAPGETPSAGRTPPPAPTTEWTATPVARATPTPVGAEDDEDEPAQARTARPDGAVVVTDQPAGVSTPTATAVGFSALLRLTATPTAPGRSPLLPTVTVDYPATLTALPPCLCAAGAR